MKTLLTELKNHILWVTFNRPDKKNALDSETFIALHQALQEALNNDQVRCVVITGAMNDNAPVEKSAFTSGMDLGMMMPDATQNSSDPAEHPASQCIDFICQFDKPMIAAVNGIGIGLGFTLLLHCDYVLMSHHARLRAPFIQLGLVPEAAASYLLAQQCGYKRAMQILISGEWLSADQALEYSIADQLCSPEELLSEAEKMAQSICRQAPKAMRKTKQLIMKNFKKEVMAAKQDEDQAFGELVGNEENMEAIMAFFEKREAKFQ